MIGVGVSQKPGADMTAALFDFFGQMICIIPLAAVYHDQASFFCFQKKGHHLGLGLSG